VVLIFLQRKNHSASNNFCYIFIHISYYCIILLYYIIVLYYCIILLYYIIYSGCGTGIAAKREMLSKVELGWVKEHIFVVYIKLYRKRVYGKRLSGKL